MGMTLFHPSPCPATPGRWTGSFGTLKPWSPLSQWQGYCIGSRGGHQMSTICINLHVYLSYKIYLWHTIGPFFYDTPLSLSPLWTAARSSARWGRFPLKNRSLGREVLLPFCFSTKQQPFSGDVNFDMRWHHSTVLASLGSIFFWYFFLPRSLEVGALGALVHRMILILRHWSAVSHQRLVTGLG